MRRGAGWEKMKVMSEGNLRIGGFDLTYGSSRSWASSRPICRPRWPFLLSLAFENIHPFDYRS